MLKQLVIFATLALAFGVEVEECTWGESYWCSSLKVAKECKAVHHCMTTVWAHQTLPKDNGDKCTFCENIIKDVKSFLDNKQTQAQIEQFLNSACSVLPASDVEACQDTVKQDLPELLKMIEQQLDPQTICAAIGLCAGLEDRVQHTPIHKKNTIKMMQMQKAVASDICADCKKFFGDIKALITDKTTEKELEDMIDEQLCAQLGGLEDTCKSLVSAYVPQILQMLQQDVQPDMVCGAIGFCNSTADPHKLKVLIMQSTPDSGSVLSFIYKLSTGVLHLQSQKLAQSGPKMPKLKASGQCVLCEFVMRELDGILAQNSTQAEIMAALDKVCSILPSTVKDECTSFVNTYGPAVIALLEQELTPAEICTALGLCTKGAIDVSAVKAGEYCTICETIIQYLDSLLESQPTVKDIEQALDKVCNFLPSSLRSQCTDIVNQYAPLIIQIVAQEATPAQVCDYIGLCTNGTSKQVTKMEKIVPQKAQLVGVDKCTWGPGYWCETRENAKKCKTEAHCEKHVWN